MVFEGYTDGSQWHGYQNVWITEEVKGLIVAAFLSAGDREAAQAVAEAPRSNEMYNLSYGYAVTAVIGSPVAGY